jgi:antitoxin VapB
MEVVMHARKMSLFRNGRSQALRIPKEFEFMGKDVLVRKEGKRLIVEEDKPSDLIAWLKTLKPIDEKIGPIEDLPIDVVSVRRWNGPGH